MYSPSKIITTISLIAACALVSTTARAVDPPPDGGYFQFNTAEGEDALFSDDTSVAWYNTAIGYHALHDNTFGCCNTATGASALAANTGNNNTATGTDALAANGTGGQNTATGSGALPCNTTGSFNVAIGYSALRNNGTGVNNTAIGSNALFRNRGGSNNIALGFEAGRQLRNDANIAIGNPGVSDDTGTIRIGHAGTHTNTYIAGISGVSVADGVGVVIGTDGHLGTVVSSERFKDAIAPMDKASEAILKLQPVTFRYKKELDPEGTPQFGLVAEQVEKVAPDLVARDADGKPYTVRYEAVNAMLLNEFLKEHRKVEQLEATVVEQQKRFESRLVKQDKQIEALTSHFQKVSAQLELSKPATQTAVKNR